MTQAQHAPYVLPAETEAQARALYAQMLAEGCAPRGDAGQYVLNALLAAQACSAYCNLCKFTAAHRFASLENGNLFLVNP